MPKSKSNADDALTAPQLLEARVDAMMDPSADSTKSVPTPAGAPAMPAKSAPAATVTSSAPLEPKPTDPEPESQPEPESSASITPAEPTVLLDTPQSDAAIADIVAQEADQVLAAEDAGITAERLAADEQAPSPPRRRGHPVFWFLVLLLAILAVIAAVLLLLPSMSFAP